MNSGESPQVVLQQIFARLNLPSRYEKGSLSDDLSLAFSCVVRQSLKFSHEAANCQGCLDALLTEFVPQNLQIGIPKQFKQPTPQSWLRAVTVARLGDRK